MDTGNTDIKNLFNFVSHDFGSHHSLLCYWYICCPAAGDGNSGSGGNALAAVNDNSPGKGIILSISNLFFKSVVSFSSGTSH